MASKKKVSREELKGTILAQKWQGIAAILNSAFKYGFLSILAYCGWQSIEALSGETTDADIGLNLVGGVELNVSVVVAWFFGLGGVIFGARERKLRKSNIERLGSYAQRYENDKDPSRSSSGLTPKGNTHPEDMP